MLAQRKACRARNEEPRAPQCVDEPHVGRRGVGEAADHGRYREEDGLLVARIDQRGSDRVGRESRDIVECAPGPQAPKQTEYQPVDVNQRKRVDHRIAFGPLPDLSQRIEIGRDVSARDHGTFRRAGRPGSVKDQRGTVVDCKRLERPCLSIVSRA